MEQKCSSHGGKRTGKFLGHSTSMWSKFSIFSAKKWAFVGLFPPSDLEKFNGRGPKWHFIPIQSPSTAALWKMSWIHGAKMFIPWRKEDLQVFRSQYIDVINILHIFGRKKGVLGAFPTDLEKFNGRGQKWHFFLPIQRPRRAASWKMSWIHGAKCSSYGEKKTGKFLGLSRPTWSKFLHIFGRKRGFLRLFPPT